MRLLPPIPNARISQRFGEHPAWYAPYGLAGHEGLDLAVPIGTPVRAAHDGTATVRLGSDTYGDWWLDDAGYHGDVSSGRCLPMRITAYKGTWAV